LRRGAIACLHKPFKEADLRKALKAAIGLP
jgi:FixJ family two-component response regulator